MTSLKATIRGGRLEMNVPPDWPDGTEVEIRPLRSHDVEAAEISSAEIAATLAAMDQIEPFEMSEVEEAAWASQRRSQNELEKADFAKRADELRKAWE